VELNVDIAQRAPSVLTEGSQKEPEGQTWRLTHKGCAKGKGGVERCVSGYILRQINNEILRNLAALATPSTKSFRYLISQKLMVLLSQKRPLCYFLLGLILLEGSPQRGYFRYLFSQNHILLYPSETGPLRSCPRCFFDQKQAHIMVDLVTSSTKSF
jgi:hypothetical protein